MQIDTRTFENDDVVEIYITVQVTPGISVDRQAEEVFSAIREVLETKNACILQERVLGTSDALNIVRPLRASIYGQFDDGVDPVWLVVPDGFNGPFSGVQVHAMAGVGDLQVVQLEDKPCGRLVGTAEKGYLALSGISAAEAGAAPDQSYKMLGKVESILKRYNADMLSVPRTWMWLGGILDWYDDFNLARNKFFTERKMIGKNVTTKMPASTGIGIGPNDGGICAMDITALIGNGQKVEYIDVGGNQNSAYDYGSAFSRASQIQSPAGRTVFVSGTASIDVAGLTTNIDDAEKQIVDTIVNIIAVLEQMNCKEEDVVHALVYCKTAEIEKLFCSKWADFAWPHITVIADVCRDNLLFEIEATALVPR